jgi:hypothetical protein
MQKKYELLLEVLGKLSKAGVLDETIIIGSWCMHFYNGPRGAGHALCIFRIR